MPMRDVDLEAVHCKSCEAGKFQPTTNQMVESSCTSLSCGLVSRYTRGSPVAMSAPRATTKTRRARTIVGTVLRASIIPVNKSIYCQDCSPGKREDGTRLVCENCAKGKYTLLRHQTECIVCPSGTYQGKFGATLVPGMREGKVPLRQLIHRRRCS